MVNAGLISFVARSRRRIEILILLSQSKQLSQPEIMNSSKRYKSHNSRTLKELREKGLVVCINPEDRSYKFYKITKKGKDVLRDVERIKLSKH